MAESACLQCPKPLTEATVLVRPFLLQIDTFGKWCRCLHNVCYLKLKKRRYLDKCRLSAPAGISGGEINWRALHVCLGALTSLAQRHLQRDVMLWCWHSQVLTIESSWSISRPPIARASTSSCICFTSS